MADEESKSGFKNESGCLTPLIASVVCGCVIYWALSAMKSEDEHFIRETVRDEMAKQAATIRYVEVRTRKDAE